MVADYGTVFTPVQLLGYLALVTYVSGYLVKSDNRLKLIFSGSNLLWIAHYVWIGARTAALTTAIITVRNLFALNSQDFSRRRKLWLATLFSALLTVAGAVTWAGFVSVIPVSTCIIVSFAMIYLNGVRLRLVLLVVDAAWFWHGALVHSFGGMLYGVSAVAVNGGNLVRQAIFKRSSGADGIQ